MRQFLVYDVFTEQAFGGNQLAVFPDASDLSEDSLQAIARKFNFSESTFVFPPSDPENTAQVRIFTPTSELPFAGHPVVGTAIALADLGRAEGNITFELGVGPMPVSLSGGKATFETRVPLETSPGPDAATAAALVGLTADEVKTTAHQPINAGVGLPFLLTELASTDALARAQPDTAIFRQCINDGSMRMGAWVYTRDGGAINARMFAPLAGIPEDPATGSASAALTAFLGQLDGVSQSFTIAQGVEMGRPSRIEAEVDVEAGRPVAVRIGGRAVQTMSGNLTF